MIKTRMTKIRWLKPTYIGFCVLELSKLLMYNFHYDYILKAYPNKAKLLFTDTDSLCYELHTDDAYADMKRDADRFDTSDYPVGHNNYDVQTVRSSESSKMNVTAIPSSSLSVYARKCTV